MKQILFSLSAALCLMPLLSLSAQANAPSSAVILRCREATSTEHHSLEHFSSDRTSIRDVLRQTETHTTETASVVIEIQGNCEDIRVRVDADHVLDELHSEELYPGELEPSDSYENWHEDLHNVRRPGEPRPWLTRTGSGWDWLLRTREAVNEPVDLEAAFELPNCMCVKAPCNCLAF